MHVGTAALSLESKDEATNVAASICGGVCLFRSLSSKAKNVLNLYCKSWQQDLVSALEYVILPVYQTGKEEG